MIDYKELNDRRVMLERIIKKIGFDDFDDDKYQEKAKIFVNDHNTDIVTITSTDIDSPLEDSFFVMIYDPNGDHKIEDIKEEIKSKLEKDNFFDNEIDKDNLNIEIIEVFGSKEFKMEADRSKTNINNIRNTVKKFINEKTNDGQTFSLGNIQYSDYFLPTAKLPSEFTIRIDDRVRSIENLSKGDIKLTSYVFTASVNDLITLYNTMGDSLFLKNIRIGNVKDNIDVGPAIQDTFKNNPDEFWHLNNGISLLIQSEEDINLSVFDRIKINTKPIHKISVINGAQTLTALSNTIFNGDEDGNKKNDALENAKVLLRIYSIINKNKEYDQNLKQQQFIEKITLSLNRQKPIKQADISYMTNFVENISYVNRLGKENELIDSDYTFKFIRSGEFESTALQEYSLGNFAKIVKGYLLGLPGESRTNAYATLLKTEYAESDTETHSLVQKNIFKTTLQKDLPSNKEEEIEITNHFKQNYKPVNFAMDMKEKLEDKNKFIELVKKYIKELERDSEEELDELFKENLETFGKYGVLLLISLYINLENEPLDENRSIRDSDNYFQMDNKDFSNWKHKKIGIPNQTDLREDVLQYSEWEENVLLLIRAFEEYIKEILEEGKKLDSNDYKNDSLSKDVYELAKSLK